MYKIIQAGFIRLTSLSHAQAMRKAHKLFVRAFFLSIIAKLTDMILASEFPLRLSFESLKNLKYYSYHTVDYLKLLYLHLIMRFGIYIV